MMPYIAFNYDRMRHSLFNVQVAEPFERNFELLSDTLPKMMNSGNDLYFQSVREIKSEYYKNVKEFQILVSIAAIVLLIICVIGMTGYLSDEMSRRSREIAVRKVNGASTASVVKLICKSILITSIPAVAVGIIAAWYFSRMWLEQFTVTLDHMAIRFIVSGICTVIIILGIAGGLTIRKASANPVENLRSE